MAEKFFLVDGHSHLYRAFFAVKGLTTPEGRPCNAVFGFTSMLRKLIHDHAPDYLAVAFDTPAPTFRHKIYKDYKATREKPPDEFIAQIPMAREVLDALQVPVCAVEGYEADDVLATLARRAESMGMQVFLVTGDKDAEQLLSGRVSILDSKGELLTPEKLMQRDGITPEQVIEVMALCGDSSDNIKGIPKVGPKTALELIRRYKTMENVLAHAQEIKQPKLRENLIRYADQARLSKKLVILDVNVPIGVSLEQCRLKPPDPARVLPVFRKLGFHQFISEMSLAPTKEETCYQLVDSEEKLTRFLEELRRQKRVAIDLETTSATPMAAKICGISFSWEPRRAWYLPLRAPATDKVLNPQTTLAALKPVLTDPAVAKVGQNIKYDMVVLRNNGIQLEGVAFDTMIAAYVLNPERRRYSLDSLALDFLNYTMIPIEELIGKGKKQITMDRVPVEKVCNYSCADADITLRLCELLEKQLRDRDMYELFAQVEMPLVSVLADMEFQGIRLDASEMRAMSEWLDGQLASLEKDIYREAKEQFNISSPRQLAAILFDKLKLPRGRRTKTGVSTDSEVLEELAIAHRLPGLILEYRQLSKLKSTYVDALPAMVLSQTGKIHTSFNQTATATGRLSSSDPNLQNIPVRTELGERIRKAFVPSSPDNLLLAADYSQIELRIMAHVSGDASLRRAFAEDADIHRFVAAQIHGVKPEEVTPAMRRAAKTVNFGIIYGLTPFGLSKELRITPDEAARFIDEYFKRYPGVKQFIERTVEEARRTGYVTTLLGRRRPLPALNDPDRATRSFAERAAVNTVIQGTAADMIKVAMIRIHRRLQEENLRAKMILQIHDELLFDLPPEEEKRISEIVTDSMTTAVRLDVPIKVNLAVGKNWMEAK